LEKKDATSAGKLRVLDPACGSGSFLIGAYQYLLDWHLKYYAENEPEKWARQRNPRIYEDNIGGWKLTTGERKRILLNNIYGVDIDSQAVEVTKLSLLLKVLEGESQASLDNQLRLFHERALPDLSSNIKCGNSLIGPDFYEGRQMELFDDEEMYRINAFDWEAEFADVFKGKNPGFDAVIGNPPYVSFYSKQSEGNEQLESLVDYWRKTYAFIEDKCKLGRYNTAMFFLEKAMTIVVPNGFMQMIVDTNFYSNPSIPIRKYLLNNFRFIEIVTHFSAFANVGSSQVILLLQNAQRKSIVRWKTINEKEFVDIGEQHQIDYCSGSFDMQPPKEKREIDFVEKLNKNTFFLELIGKKQIRTCITFTGQKDKFILQKPTESNHYPLIEGSKGVAGKYCPIRYSTFVNYDLSLRDCLNEKYREIAKKQGKRTPMVIGLGDMQAFRSPKLFLRLSDIRITATYSDEVVCADLSLYVITLPNKEANWKGYNIKYFLGLLNSSTLTIFARLTGIIRNLATGTPQIRLKDIRLLPMREIDFQNSIDRTRHDKMVSLVDRMLELHKQLGGARVADEKRMLERQIEAVDGQIDRLVYELYGLSDDEIGIVEGK
jgi:hypothetical protein